MKSFFTCGILIGIVIALLVCAAVYFFLNSRQDPEGAGKQIHAVESGWEKFKSGGDKGLEFVKRTIPGQGGEANVSPNSPGVPGATNQERPADSNNEGASR